jgi:hypothetical protein
MARRSSDVIELTEEERIELDAIAGRLTAPIRTVERARIVLYAAQGLTNVECVLGMAVCIPYLVYTYSNAHRIFYWSDSGGSQLYWMASGQSSDLGDWHNSPTVFTDPHLAPHRPFFRWNVR